MVENLTKTIAYICPYCSGVTQKQIGIFRFSGNSATELLCTDKNCHEACASIQATHDKYKIIVDCPICGESHCFKISKSAFWNKDIISFRCNNTGISIFFIGNKKLVTKAVDENNVLLEEMADEFDIHQENIELIFGIIDDLHRILNEGRISCKCGGQNIVPTFDDRGIMITCNDCGNKILLSPTPEVLDNLSGMGKFVF